MAMWAQTPGEIRLLSALGIIIQTLLSERKPRTAPQKVLDYLTQNLKAAGVVIIWKYDLATGRLIPQNVSGVNADLINDLQVNPDKDVISRVFRTGEAKIYPAGNQPDTESFNITINKETDHYLNYPVSAACFPLGIEQVKYGVLSFLNLEGGTGFTPEEISFFQVIAHVYSMILERADFVKELEINELVRNDDRYKAALIPTLAHEMRTPLTSIKGYSTALLMEEASFSSETQREFLSIIDRECSILEGLISDYLESSIIDAGRIKLDYQPVRLNRLAAKVADEVGRLSPKHSLIVDFPADFPLIDADPERITQVIRQLLDNAAKYSPKGGIIIIQGVVVDDHVVISVADEGVGIDPKDLNHLFDKYFRAKMNLRNQNKITGTGLGLPISRAIVEAHGGRIWAESQLGQGSKFFFNLPVNGPSSVLNE
jgi:signal transduction histidine kinase